MKIDRIKLYYACIDITRGSKCKRCYNDGSDLFDD